MKPARAVFLDRDGVLNEPVIREGRPYPPTLENFKVCAGAAAALGQLKAAGFLLVVVTNQPDVARGTQTREALAGANRIIQVALPVDDIRVCCHDDGNQCACRKPKPGLLLEAAAEYGIDLARSFLIGDRWRDIDAGAAAGCRTILIDYHYRERSPEHVPDFRCGALPEAVEWILKQG